MQTTKRVDGEIKRVKGYPASGILYHYNNGARTTTRRGFSDLTGVFRCTESFKQLSLNHQMISSDLKASQDMALSFHLRIRFHVSVSPHQMIVLRLLCHSNEMPLPIHK